MTTTHREMTINILEMRTGLVVRGPVSLGESVMFSSIYFVINASLIFYINNLPETF